MKSARILINVCTLLCLTAAAASAAVVQPKNLTEMTRDADVVVLGTVTRQWSAWDTGKQFIWTHIEISVQEMWKGPNQNRVILSEIGGMVDGIGMAAAGVPTYETGSRVVVFARRMPTGILRTASLSLGKLDVIEAAGSPAYVRSTVDGLTTQAVPGAPHRTAAVVTSGTTLPDLRSRVSQILSAEGSK